MPKKHYPDLGSLFMVGIPGKVLDNSTIKLITESRIHNFILFTRNVVSRKQLQNLCGSITDLCLANNLPKPLISIDQEGGSVTRLPPPFSQFPDQRILAQQDNCEDELLNYASICATELKDVGINMNLAPVLDICRAGKGYFMERRCLGDNPSVVARLGTLVFQEMQKAGVAACAKHFPGLGQAVIDPHLELPVVSSGRNEMAAADFIPFKAASKAGIAAFMTSHTIYNKLDSTQPATLSPLILHDILRKEIGYAGMVITDDLEMGAIERTVPVETAAVEAFVAGSDLMLICQDHQKIKNSLANLQKAYKDKVFSQEYVEGALLRQKAVRELYA